MTEPIKLPIPGPFLEEGRTDGRQVPERPYVKPAWHREPPAPTTLPGPGEQAGLPTARVHGARPTRSTAVAAIVLLIALGFALHHMGQAIDSAERWAHVARSEARLARAEARRAVIVHRDVKPPNDPLVEVCVRRTDALRAAIFALVRIGNASMTGDPSWTWADWPSAISSPRTRTTEARQ